MKRGRIHESFHSLKLGRVNINLSNRWLYTLIAFGILIFIAIRIYALGYIVPGASSIIPNPGHNISEIQTCGPNQTLQTNSSGTGWSCVDFPSSNLGSSSGIPTSVIYTNAQHSGGAFYTYGSTSCLDGTTGSNGYQCMNNWIQSHGCAGYHVCSTLDFANALQTGVSINPVPNGGFALLNSFYLSSLSGGNNDCTAWTASDTSYAPAVTNTKGVTNFRPALAYCNSLVYVACCK